ncbi:Gfo/Idh/MocA family oxidoreductase [Paenarthrobacter sp. OM7]|uniref:Gfo/Idh/MocA family protein n=1 Tax=Paenarthrobacter sp. OM7 TaxID=3041264 RepID=UPI0024695D4B|nr:Gfo/Idh/MocA family oxidoreductase [Paenarthrobacter sp. OM7]WGM20302.1 Gfo/Idh/MocA family oxidoreductase [Paenarthrobacter sp. OM7]
MEPITVENDRRPVVAVAGLGFGAEFAPIYRDHPDVQRVVICDGDEEVLNRVGDELGIEERYLSLEDVLAQPHIDAVHLVTALPDHGEQSIAVLKSGKHCASTVPMAISLEEMSEIVRWERESGKNYMMMETAVYTREFLHCQELFQAGAFGPITFGKGVHYQDMEGWPSYWEGLPPHWYMTHAISPLLRLLDTRATTVRCLGSGQLPANRQTHYSNPYPAQTAIFELEGTNVSIEVSRTLFQAARSYTEAFSIYGENYGFEWPQIEGEPPVHYMLKEANGRRGRTIESLRIEAPERTDLLPLSIARYTQDSVYSDGSHSSFIQGSGHGGSHPHLVHEFVTSIVEQRPSSINAVVAANWTAAGVAAHQSAMNGGETVHIPSFELHPAPAG